MAKTGETASSIEPPERRCHHEDPNIFCNEETCSYCNSQREADSQTVRGTLLVRYDFLGYMEVKRQIGDNVFYLHMIYKVT